ncbi:hypothetical protein GCM10011504_11090 [Siccirubricoccus deserti]|uniref:Uncharacterized protein n=1 Tax=Siccirubricoccus deserti TaxID=2013562 RepID=A0A9X0UC31_9PROT|nr:hypothetical protein [Siccirubricoccus deserti]MBC4014724.1 hypothetical protein [Siccirubricoccus deserti]GGC34495.1 hypothetical protein GCM10011504_11090 [Siccirubricoccus deserti]
MIPLAVLLLLAAPAAAQRPGCGFGLGLEALGQAQRSLGSPAGSLSEGRVMAGAAAGALGEAAGRFAGCGCTQAAGDAREAAGLAEQATAEPALERLRRLLDRAGFSARLVHERLERRGCG